MSRSIGDGRFNDRGPSSSSNRALAFVHIRARQQPQLATLRPHVAAGTAKAAEDAWKLAEAIRACQGDVVAALERWEPGQLQLGRGRAREAGDRFQFKSSWRIGEPLPLGLYRPGDSALN